MIRVLTIIAVTMGIVFFAVGVELDDRRGSCWFFTSALLWPMSLRGSCQPSRCAFDGQRADG